MGLENGSPKQLPASNPLAGQSQLAGISLIGRTRKKKTNEDWQSAGSDRPRRRTALVGRNLGIYGIQLAALSDTWFADVGEMTEIGAGYTFFWSGRKSEAGHEAGVGFAI